MRDVLYIQIYIYIYYSYCNRWSGTPDFRGRQMLSINPRKIVQSRETSNVSIGPIRTSVKVKSRKARLTFPRPWRADRHTEFRAQVAHRIALRGLWIQRDPLPGVGVFSSVQTWRVIFVDNFGHNTRISDFFPPILNPHIYEIPPISISYYFRY